MDETQIIEENETLKTKVETLEGENAAISEELETAKTDLAAAQESVTTACEELATAQESVKSLSEENETLKTKVETVEAENETLKADAKTVDQAVVARLAEHGITEPAEGQADQSGEKTRDQLIAEWKQIDDPKAKTEFFRANLKGKI